MINLLVVGFMWLLVVVLSLRARTRPDNTMLRAAIVIAASLTTNIDDVYLWAGELLPWPNVLDLVSNVLLVVGVYFLSRAIVQGAAAFDEPRGRGRRWTLGAALIAVAVMLVSFSLIDAPASSTRFMLDYGDQLAAGVYSGIQYAYIFAVMAGTVVTCIRNVPHMRRLRFRIGFRLIGIGCGAGLLLCSSVIAMDIAHVAGADAVVRGLGPIYDVSYLLTVALLVAGLAVPPLVRVMKQISVRRQIQAVEPGLKSLWLRTVATAPAVSLVGTTAQSVKQAQEQSTRDASDTIHRLVIEIHDWLDANGGSSAEEELSAPERALLEQAEALCLKQGRSL